MILVQSLGTATIRAGQTQVTPSSVRKFALLLYLSVESGRRISRTALQELIFPDQTEKNGRHSLRELIYQLRQRGFPVDASNEGLVVHTENVQLDFVDAIACEKTACERLNAIGAGFLPSYAPDHSESFSEWLEALRARVTSDLCKSLVTAATRAREVGDWARVERLARACLSLEPLNEGATLALAESLALNGSKMQAVSLLDSYMNEVGRRSADLRLSAAILKRRIGEKRPDQYRNPAASPFVGRESEMTQLRERFAISRMQASQCVVIAGEPGVGKSRLAAEFAALAALDGAHVERVSAQPHDLHRPMGAFVDLVSSLLRARGALGCSPESMQALRSLTNSPATISPTITLDAGDSEIREYAIAGAISDLIDAITAEAPLVILVEDAHWLDGISLRSLGDIVSVRRRRQLFVLLTTRAANVTRAFPAHTDYVTTLDTRTLESGSASQLADALIRNQGLPVDGDLRRWIDATADGNPLFLESLLAHYARTGERFAVPPTLMALVGRRVDCVSTQARTVLNFCVLLGKHSRLELLERSIKLPRIELLPAIADLERAQLIQDVEGRIAPTHPLIAEAAQQRLASIERRLAHHCIAGVLEQVALSDDSAALAWECAEHWLAAEDSARAIAAVRRCATHAMEIGRPGAAAEMLLRLGTLHIDSDELDRIGRQAVKAADAASEPELVFGALKLIRDDRASKRHDDVEFAEFRAASRTCQEAGSLEDQLYECIAADAATPDHRVTAATSILKYCHSQGRRSAAFRAIEALPAEVLVNASALTRLEFLLVRHSAFGESKDSILVAKNILGNIGDVSPIRRVHLRQNVSFAYWHAGMSDEAVAIAIQAHEDCYASGARRLRLKLALQIADFLFDLDREELAREWLDRAVAFTAEVPSLARDLAFVILMLESLLEDGETSRARTLLSDVEAEGLFCGALRRRWLFAFALRLREISGEGASKEELDQLLTEPSEVSPMTGIRDFEIATACHALLDRGQLATASAVIRHYSLERKGRSPFTRPLRRAVQRLA